MKFLLACDRSGGHVFPALAAARELKRRGHEVVIFTASPFFRKLIEEEGVKVKGSLFSFRNLFIEFLWRIPEALYLILLVKPQKVVGFGGRDSFFLVVFGSLLFLDSAVYEPHVVIGRANRVLSFFVKRVLSGLRVNFPPPACRKTQAVGVVLREKIVRGRIDKGRAKRGLGFDSRPVLLAVGGSQGASFINKICFDLARELGQLIQVIHVTGCRQYIEISQKYNKIGIRSIVKDFCYDMGFLYSAADVVVCRAGATTLAEVAFYGLAPVLIPHPGGGGHQKANSRYFRDRGAALVFFQENFSFTEFKSQVAGLLNDSGLRQRMVSALAKINPGVSPEGFCRRAGWIS